MPDAGIAAAVRQHAVAAARHKPDASNGDADARVRTRMLTAVRDGNADTVSRNPAGGAEATIAPAGAVGQPARAMRSTTPSTEATSTRSPGCGPS